MIRQLLTLLAVLTGLTTAVAPAHALGAGVQAVEMAQEAGTCHVHPGVLALAAEESIHPRSAPQRVACPPPVILMAAPSVIVQVDRARE